MVAALVMAAMAVAGARWKSIDQLAPGRHRHGAGRRGSGRLTRAGRFERRPPSRRRGRSGRRRRCPHHRCWGRSSVWPSASTTSRAPGDRPPRNWRTLLRADPGMKLVKELPRSTPSGVVVALIRPPIKEDPPPDAEALKYFGRGLTVADQRALASSARPDRCSMFAGPGNQALAANRRAMKLVADLAGTCGEADLGCRAPG